MRRGVARLLLVVITQGILACAEREPGEPARPREVASFSSPAHDTPGVCGDLATARVCYGAACPRGVCVRPRPAEDAASTRAYRCQGAAEDRRCRARTEFASPFVCQRGHCVQRQPRLPDDGEWECADIGGAVLCRGGAAPAAVVRSQIGWGFACSPRPGHPKERLCLDIDPDLPVELGEYVACRFETVAGKLVRRCESSRAPRLGSACETDSGCPSGGRCIGAVCVPPSLEPACWKDVDCGPERCSLASCGQGPR